MNYAKQQEIGGNIKSTIATLERLSKLYPKNSDIKIYLLSILPNSIKILDFLGDKEMLFSIKLIKT